MPTDGLLDAAVPGRSRRAASVRCPPVEGSEEGAVRRRAGGGLRLQALRILLDVLALAGAVALAFPMRFQLKLLESTPGPLPVRHHLIAAGLWIVGVIGPMGSHRLYDEDTLASGGREMTRVRRSLVEGVALVSTAVFLLQLVTVSRGWFVHVVVLSTIFLSVERRMVRTTVRRAWARGRLRRTAILISSGPIDMIDPSLGEFDVVETVRPDQLAAVLGAPDHGRSTSDVAPVVIVDGQFDRDELWRLVLQAGDAGSSIFLSSPFRALPADRLTTRSLGERTIVKVSPPAITGIRAVEKRLLDIMAAIALLALASIPMTLIALGILLSAGRPVFYRQQRVGMGGRLFLMWKFRTMRTDAEEGSGAVWAAAADPRRTTFGAILRRLSLDELPQLWNVLRGEMSIVGPRPERPVFVDQFNEDHLWYRFRHRTRPGITGLSQVNGLRGDTPVEPRVEADNWYIENWSLTLDLRIAARTFLAMLVGRNAY